MGGEWRARRLETPVGRGHRPTQGRVREALFAALGGRVRDAVVVDLFAGCGTLGLEALSRGARRAVFIECAPPALVALRGNVARCRAGERVRIVAAAVEDFLSGNQGVEAEVALALADPPYDRGCEGLMEQIAASRAMQWASAALMVVEHACRAGLPRVPSGWHAWRPRRYGETCLAIAERKNDECGSSDR